MVWWFFFKYIDCSEESRNINQLSVTKGALQQEIFHYSERHNTPGKLRYV